jgi:LysM repeat protein
MMEASETKATEQEREDEATPQVFALQRDLNGWRFSRRDFLAAASAAAAAVVAGKTSGCTPARTTATAETPSLTRTARPAKTAKTPAVTPVIHKVQSGDTLAEIAEQYDVTVEALKEANGLESDLIQVGQELIIPVADQPTPESAPATEVTGGPLAQFITDVTIPDGTVMEPGHAFTKTWRLKNVGTVEWGEGTHLDFLEGEQMGAPSPVAVPNVPPGETVDISVDLVAPAEVGNYTGRWRLFATDGTRLMTITVVIVVASTEEIPAGEEGVKIEIAEPDGTTRTWTLPCGSPIPPGAVCVCNCVSVPASCACVGHCSCDAVSTHYWYPC